MKKYRLDRDRSPAAPRAWRVRRYLRETGEYEATYVVVRGAHPTRRRGETWLVYRSNAAGDVRLGRVLYHSRSLTLCLRTLARFDFGAE